MPLLPRFALVGLFVSLGCGSVTAQNWPAKRLVEPIYLPVYCDCRPTPWKQYLQVELDHGTLLLGGRALTPDNARFELNAELDVRKKTQIVLFPRKNATIAHVTMAMAFLRTTKAEAVHLWLFEVDDATVLSDE